LSQKQQFIFLKVTWFSSEADYIRMTNNQQFTMIAENFEVTNVICIKIKNR